MAESAKDPSTSIANFPLSLDVILVRGSSTQSTCLCVLQSIAMLRSVSFSHVVLSIAEGVCLHATTRGVGLIRPSEIWTLPNYRARKVVLRSTKIRATQTDEPLQQEHEFARKVFGARYNHFFGIPKGWIGENAWFCSELAATALQKVGHQIISNRNAEKIWPGHFQHCEVGTEWQDVTNYYDTYIAEVTKGATRECRSSILATH